MIVMTLRIFLFSDPTAAILCSVWNSAAAMTRRRLLRSFCSRDTSLQVGLVTGGAVGLGLVLP